MMTTARVLFAGMLSVLPAAFSLAQQVTGINVPKKDHVTILGESQSIAANRPSTLMLHFTVEPGFHINSHTPTDETLIPTRLAVEDDAGYSVRSVTFPNGSAYSFSFAPKEKLSVYTGDFALTVHVTAKPGVHRFKAALAYQACDTASCYPPRTLPVILKFTAK